MRLRFHSANRTYLHHAWEFIEQLYALSERLIAERQTVRIRIEPEPGYRAGPVFGVRILSV